MNARLPGWIVAVLAIQAALALLFFAMGWSHTASLTFGRTPPLQDLALLAAPIVAVALCAWLARSATRRGQRGNAALIAFLPFPISLLLFGLIGAV
jgi:hypothetical protein